MKKLIAIAVLFVGITAAVLAQEGEWKVGFMAQYTADMLYATSVKDKTVTTSGGNSEIVQFGNYNKGTINFFPNDSRPSWQPATRRSPHADNRLEVQLSNEGENYKVFLPIALDNWVNNFSSVGQWLINGSPGTDWYIRGNAGMFNGQIGSEGYGGFVDTRATWNGWLGWNMLCRYGVWRFNKGADSGFVVSDQFRTWDEWGTIVALGATFADNYKFSIGYKIDPDGYKNEDGRWLPGGTERDSKSSINASFLFSGRPVDGVTFDLFYAVIGKDDETMWRPRPVGAEYYTPPTAKWRNTIGAYVGLDIIENLGISLGYAVHFNAYEAGGYAKDGVAKNSTSVTYKAPIYSGIDLHLKYNGIDKVGLTFNNNVSFAGVKGQKSYFDYDEGQDIYSDTLVVGLGESGLNDASGIDPADGGIVGEGWSQDWFHWNTELTASLGFIDGVGLTVSLGDQLGAAAVTYVNPDVDAEDVKQAGVQINNKFRVSLFANHGIGAVSVGAGLFFEWKSSLTDYVQTLKSGSGTTVHGTSDTVTFGIPLLFKVAF